MHEREFKKWVQEKRTDLLAQVAVWYYEDGMNQDEIGKLIGKSRSMVSRMLNEVRELGLIEIKIKYPLKRNYFLEEKAKLRFGLKDVWLVNSSSLITQEMKRNMVGELSARCLLNYFRPGIKVGIGWSRTLYKTFKALPKMKIENSVVIQMSGSVSLDAPMFDGIDLARELARKLGAQHYYFPAPLVVSHPEVRERLMGEQAIQVAMEKARDVDLAIVGIGNVSNHGSSLIEGGLIDEEFWNEINARNLCPAGDILAQQIDTCGHLLDISMNERVIGIHLEELKQIPIVVAVSAGPEKVKPIYAAIKGGWINILVSDDETMNAVMDVED